MHVRPTRVRGRFKAFAVLCSALGLAFALAGCANPNFIGIQDYGDIGGNVVDQSAKPVANAIVSVGSLETTRSNPDGSFSLQHIPVGQQVVTVSTGTATGQATVIVTKDQSVNAGNIVLQTTSGP